MATFVGTVFDDEYFGTAANEYGLDGDDILSPSADNKQYSLYGGNGNDFLDAFSFDDFLYGGNGNDTMFGRQGWDLLEGGAGNDELDGGGGRDTLIGGPGFDFFVFDTTPNSNNFDRIEDFKAGTDLVELDNDAFIGVGPGNTTLANARFHVGSSFTNSSQRILYNPGTGNTFYDRDGSGGAFGSIRFAILDRQLPMDNTDFFILA